MTAIKLETLDHCFHGIVPGVIATCDREGVPNVSYLSQVHLVDERHVALSCQFFNKTRQNLDQNPRATFELYDPMTWEAYRLRLLFVRSETSGPLFETMAARILAIASHSGMAGIFKLRSADVFEVQSIEKKDGFVTVPAEDSPDRHKLPEGPLTELRGLQLVSERVMRAADLESLLSGALTALDEVFGFSHGMILMPEDDGKRLVTVASHGYGDDAVGAEVRFGDGLIGTVAEARRLLRVSSVSSDLRYGRAIREAYQQQSGPAGLSAEIPLPGLCDAKSQMAIPLMVQDRLIGVLALECRDALTFAQWHEAFLQILANQIASGIDRMADRDDDVATSPGTETSSARMRARARSTEDEPRRKRSFCYYKNDDCVFVDGEYLIRNVPGKILWKILRAHQTERRTEFSNRELRLDPSLGLPAFKDNLESRLILLRKRLEQKCPDVRIASTRRGRFALSVDSDIELVERETA
jgi:adenylate cyclase